MSARPARLLLAAVVAVLVVVAAHGAGDAQTRPPLTVHFASPSPGATVGGDGIPIQTDGSGGADPDGNFIVQRHYVFKIDGVVAADYVANLPDNHQEGVVGWNSTAYPDGPHLFQVTVTDELGASASATAAYGALNHPSGPGAGGSALTASILTSKPAGALSGLVAIAVRADHAPEGASAQLALSLDGQPLVSGGALCHSGSCMWSWLWDTTTVTNGTHTLTGTVTGSAGSKTASLTVTVSNATTTGPKPVVWTAPVNVAVSGNTITKNSGCNGCGDAGAASQQTIGSGDGAAEFATSSGMQGTVGLSVGNPGTSGSEIMFGLRFYPGYVEVRESGVYKADWPLGTGAVHKVAVEGGAVKYYAGGTLKYTSAKPPIYPLLLDASVNSSGGSVQNATITSGGGGGGTPSDTTAPSVAITAPAGGSTVSGTVTVTASATDHVGVAGVQLKVDGVTVGSADTTAPYAFAWNSAAVANGAHTLTVVATDFAGNSKTSAPVTVTVSNSGGGPAPGTPQNVTWTSAVNVAVSGNTITKNAGCSGCADAGAVSQQMITSGDGWVTFTVSSGAHMTVGLGSGNSGTGTDVEFGLRFYPAGYVEVREAGVYKWDFALVAGATYKVAVENGSVKYYQNGALKYTSATPPTFPLLLDTSLLSLGAAVQSAVLGN